MLYDTRSHNNMQQAAAKRDVVAVVWSGDRSQPPTKATSQSTARTCHMRMVLPAAAAAAAAAAGRQGCSFVISWG